jgi:hypothetical protein
VKPINVEKIKDIRHKRSGTLSENDLLKMAGLKD